MKLYRIKKSTIDQKGRGLYATCNIKEGTKIIDYVGKLISKKQTEAKISSNWIDKSSSPEEMKKMFEGLYELMFLNSETIYRDKK